MPANFNILNQIGGIVDHPDDLMVGAGPGKRAIRLQQDVWQVVE